MTGLFPFLWAVFVSFLFLRAESVPLKEGFLSLFSALPVLSQGAWWLGLFQAGGSTAIILLAAYFAGRRLLNFFPNLDATVFERRIWRIVLGLGFISIFILILGLIHLMKPAFIAGLLIATAIGGVVDLIRSPRPKIIFSLSGTSVLIGALFFVGIAVQVLIAMLPEIFYDALVYHLGLVNCYLQHEKIVTLPHLMATFPMAIQFLYAAGLSLGGESVCKLIHASLLMLSVLGLVSLGRRLGRPLGGWIAGLIYFWIPVVQLNAVTSGVDVGVALFGIIAVSVLIAGAGPHGVSRSNVALSSVFAGLAVGSKYSSALIPILLIGLLFFLSPKDRSRYKNLIRLSLMVAGITVLVWIPWGIKNTIQFKNPIAPFLNEAVNDPSFPKEKYQHWISESRASRRSPVELPKDLWKASLIERNSYFFLGPVFLGLFPFLVFQLFKNKNKNLFLIAGGGAAYLLIGLSYSGIFRYWLPGLALLAVVWGTAGEIWWKEEPRLGKWAFGVSFLGLLLIQAGVSMAKCGAVFKPDSFRVTGKTETDYLAAVDKRILPNPSHALYRWINSNLPPKSVIMILGDEKVYPLKRPYYYSGVFNDSWIVQWSNGAGDSDAIGRSFEAAKIDYLVFNPQESVRLKDYGFFNFTPEGRIRFETFWIKRVRLVHTEIAPSAFGGDNQLALYKIYSLDQPSQTPPQELPI